MCDATPEPDYVNDLPEGSPENTPRCQYEFEHDHKHEGKSVQGHLCGLPVPDDETGNREHLCYFHSRRSRKADSGLKPRLEQPVAGGAYLGEARLEKAQLGDADLANAYLVNAELGEANLRHANLRAGILVGANLKGACLYDAYLEGVNFRGAILSGADLRWAVIASAQQHEGKVSITRVPDLRDANLQAALLGRVIISPDANLTGADLQFSVTPRSIPWYRLEERWRWNEYCLQDERCARSDQHWEKVTTARSMDKDDRPTLSECERTYRQLKLSYQESGDYQTAGEFFLREMECKRAQMVVEKKPLWQQVWPALMYFVCGYGERPKWIAAWALGLVALFAFFHGWAGIINPYTGEFRIGPGIAWATWGHIWETVWQGFNAWLSCLYFSAITFTSLGYADLAPAPGIGRALAGLEAALGIVIMSLFLICIVRKYSR